MKRSRRVALAALCVLALALGAATLNDTTAPGGSGVPGQSDGDTFDLDPDRPQDDSTDDQRDALFPRFSPIQLCIEFLTTNTFYALVLVGFLALGTVLYRKGGPLLAIAGFGVLFTPGFVIWAILTTCTPPDFPNDSSASNNSGASGGLFGGETGGVIPSEGTPDVSHAILLVTAVLVILVALFMLRATDDDRDAEDGTEEAEQVPPESLAGLAGVAGAAADRIESGDVDTENEVYRAWREMTDYLDVENPRTATPAEFRAAAREAGMDSPDVDALTDLFREVRYGGESPTADREAAAVDALRAIEDAYGERGTDGA